MTNEGHGGTTHRIIDAPADAAPAVEIVKTITDLEETDPTSLAPVWECIDDALTPVCSNSLPSDTDLEVTFNYEGYRITVEQNGTAQFVPLDE